MDRTREFITGPAARVMAATVAVIGSLVVAGPEGDAAAQSQEQGEWTICHGTGEFGPPYDRSVVTDEDEIGEHRDHEHDAIFEGNVPCPEPLPDETTTTTAPEETTTTTVPEETTTTTVPAETTTTTVPEETTTTTVPKETTTTSTTVAETTTTTTVKGRDAKVEICHGTNSIRKPYVSITVSENAVDGIAGNSGNQADHFGEHQGPIASSEEVARQLKADKTEWGDIIPPVKGGHNGLNFTDVGRAMLENNCDYVEAPDGTTTTTAAPGETTTTTALDGTTTTTAAGNTTTTLRVAPPPPRHRVDRPGGVDVATPRKVIEIGEFQLPQGKGTVVVDLPPQRGPVRPAGDVFPRTD